MHFCGDVGRDFAMLMGWNVGLGVKLPPKVPPAFELHFTLARSQKNLNKTKSSLSLKGAKKKKISWGD